MTGAASSDPAASATSPAVAPAPTPAANSNGIADIVVTAQKRSENLQSVPIAITALSGQQLAATGSISTADLKAVAPGLQFNTSLAGFGQPRIRGIGTTAQGPGIENPVATYVDGIYIGSSTGALFSLNDVDQVAVLKGPQGTLFGRNATGGLIQVTTKSPTQEAHMDLTATYGNFATAGGSLYATGGLTSNLAASIAVIGSDQADGWGRNLYNGKYVEKRSNWASRGKLLWKPGDSTRFTLSADYSELEGSDPALRTIGNTVFGTTTPGGYYDVDLDIQPELKTRNWGVSLTGQHDFENVQLLSITAYRDSYLRTTFDGDQVPVDGIGLFEIQRDKQFSQELQLLSTAPGPFKWVVGAYYFHQKSEYDPVTTTGIFIPVAPITLYVKEPLNSYAGFAQGTYTLGESTNFTAGIRYTSDHRKVSSTETFVVSGFPITEEDNGAKTFNKLTWRLSIDHRFSPELLVYASYNRGFKSGAFQAESFPPQLLKPETLDAYEAGFKADLFDRKVRLNVSGFYYNYDNLQVVAITNGLYQIYNSSGAHIYGLDGDLQVRATHDLSLTAGVSVLHDRYKMFNNALITTPNGFGNTVTIGSATGNRLQNTPDATFNVGAVYDKELSFGDITAAANYYYNSGFYTDPDNRLKQKHYNTLDASLTWTTLNKTYSIKLWGKNLTDAHYAQQLGESDVGDNNIAAAPRTYGVTAGLHF